MAYAPQPFVATQSGAADEAPSSAKPIALYGVEGGGSDITLPLGFDDVATQDPEGNPYDLNDAFQGISGMIETLQGEVDDKAYRDHIHAADDITSGTLTENRIPDLPISKVTGLQDALDNKIEAPIDPEDISGTIPAGKLQIGESGVTSLELTITDILSRLAELDDGSADWTPGLN